MLEENEVELLNEIREYLKYRKKCFNDRIQYIPNVDYDKIINARYCKISRIKKRLLYMFTHRKYIYFVTFTFDNETITKCDRTKLDSIKNSLKSFSSDILIIMNRDFGKRNDREHFHCLVGTDNNSDILQHICSCYKSRFNVERVSRETKDLKKLSKYINKLTNHCVKDTTHRFRMYYNFKGFDNLDSFYYLFNKVKYNL